MSRIIVKNLPNSGVSDKDIRQHFHDIDTVTDVKLNYNEFGAFRRFAFVGFKSENAAEKAIEKLNNSFVKNSKIVVEPCKAIREVKPNKLSQKVKKDEHQSDDHHDENNHDHNGNQDDQQRKRKETKNKKSEDVFDEVKDDPQFKEFLELQMNVAGKSESKQIWADDLKMDINNVGTVDSDDHEVASEDAKNSPLNGDLKPKKKHKRSRPKKISTKTKPKELFVHTVKIDGFQETVRRKDIKDFFKPLELISVRINKKDGICFASFKDESDLRFALRKNLQFWQTSRIRILKHDVTRSRVFKETAREKVKEKEDKYKKYESSLADTEPIEESGRLFVRNLNYSCTHDDLEQVFSPYGQITELHYPIDKSTSMPKGYAYVEFMFPKDAASAYQELNGTIFQGRNFHLIPSKPKPEPSMLNGANTAPMGPWTPSSAAMSSFKKEKFAQQKEQATRASNWNILFLGQNALADVVSEARGVDKSRLLTQQTQQDPIAVRMALGDTMVVEETRKFLISNGIELDSFDNPQAPRNKTVIIAKNLPSQTTKTELANLFELHGKVARVIMPPKGLTAIIEMEEPSEAKLAFKRLAYSKFKDSVLFLEWAPINVFREKSLEDQEANEAKEMEAVQTGNKILVKNIPFEASQQEVKKIFASFGKLNFVRIPKKIDGQHRGFGFVDYLLREDAARAFRSVSHSTHLYGRKLVLEWAKASANEQEAARESAVANTAEQVD